MADRSYLSIGQVLDLLKREFPDLTISKIRFLESQGLLDPERTPSGYRKFYGADIERLRFILSEQQQHYLPLKVIKGRLGMDPDAEPVLHAGPDADQLDDAEPAALAQAGPGPLEATTMSPARTAGASRWPVAPAASSGAAPQPVAGRPVPTAEVPTTRNGPAARIGDRTRRSPALPPLEVVSPPPSPADPDWDEPPSMTLEELATSAGLSVAEVTELERFGLISGRRIVGTTYYDGDCVEIAALAAAFGAFGVQARHLRMYRTAVEREAGFFEQVVTPMLKQRNPQARRQAVETLTELSRLGHAMRAAILRQALREYTGGS